MHSFMTSIRLRSLPTMATVVADGAPVVPFGVADGLRYSTVEQLLATGKSVDGIVLSPVDAIQAQRWLSALRRDPRYGLRLLLLTSSFGPAVDALSDGLAGAPEMMLERARVLRDVWNSLDRPAPAEGDDELLTFLYLHSDCRLEPVGDWRDEQLCRYPLADVFARGREDGFHFLERLRQRGLLERGALIERLHVCPGCEHAHLLFNELCPQCGSIDVAEQNFLHCYACGSVAPQQDYVGRDGLRCPKCSVRLRHIGVDYDRALETLSCHACTSRFTEPRVMARCLRCRKQHAPETLVERRLHSLRLSAAGEHVARTGSTGDLFKLLDEMSQAHPAYFMQSLDWLLGLARRHSDVHFSLIGLKFANIESLTARLPRARVAQMVDALAQRLRELVRTTDLLMRDEEQLCWLLLPQTSSEGLAVLRARIEALSAATVQEGGERLELKLAVAHSGEIESETDAQVVMGTLRSALR
jgi:hypothetical protein